MALMRSMSMTLILVLNLAFSHACGAGRWKPLCGNAATMPGNKQPGRAFRRGDETTRMLWLATSMKLVCEVALMALLGRAVLGLMLGPAREANPFHRLLGWVVQPFERLAGRWHVAVLLALWLLATIAKLRWCLAAGVQACR